MAVRDGRHWLWVCPYVISGLGNDRVRRVYGVDSLQALELVFAALRSDLDVTKRRLSLSPTATDDSGVMIARHLTYSMGRAFEERLYRLVRREIQAHSAMLRGRARTRG